ncbi:MAG: hypothetical protein KC731_04695 [Myxococcales bacterium]|nr:hypothetical protein [Myxococcales bacterium]
MRAFLLAASVLGLGGCWRASVRDDQVMRTLAEAPARGEARCEAGEAYACEGLGHLHLTGGVGVPSAREARRFYQRGCLLGDMRSCREGATLDRYARNIRRLASHCLRTGDPEVCLEAGDAHLYGKQLERHHGGALGLAAMSCRQGWSPGCALLGQLYAASDARLGLDWR